MFKCFTSTRGWIVLTLAILVGAYLVIWHGAHVAAALPFLVILACPLMHIFGHGRHGGHGDSKDTQSATPPATRQRPSKGA